MFGVAVEWCGNIHEVAPGRVWVVQMVILILSFETLSEITKRHSRQLLNSKLSFLRSFKGS